MFGSKELDIEKEIVKYTKKNEYYTKKYDALSKKDTKRGELLKSNADKSLDLVIMYKLINGNIFLSEKENERIKQYNEKQLSNIRYMKSIYLNDIVKNSVN